VHKKKASAVRNQAKAKMSRAARGISSNHKKPRAERRGRGRGTMTWFCKTLQKKVTAIALTCIRTVEPEIEEENETSRRKLRGDKRKDHLINLHRAA